MSRIPRCYLSGPITKGDRTSNFAQACHAQKILMEAGFAALNPMLSMMHPEAWTIPHAMWMQSDLPWVEVSDCVFRLFGESDGAKQECHWATTHGIPVFVDYDKLMEWKEEVWDKE